MKMAGIIFSNIHDNSMRDLTRNRTVASLPFGGRYRQVDFVLSNMVNSNVSTIGIITKYNYQSLMDHLGSAGEWDLNRKNGGIYFLPPFATGNSGIYRGKLEALYSSIRFLERTLADYIVLSDSTVICNINFEDVLKSHIKSGADVTVVANRERSLGSDGTMELVLSVDDGNVKSIGLNCAMEQDDLAGMEMYIIGREMLIDVVKSTVAHGFYHFEREFLQRRLLENSITVNCYEFDGVVLRNNNVANYFKNNLLLIDDTVRESIFKTGSPIYTKARDEEPSYYHEGSVVEDCLIAAGCTLEGTVINSVIFRDVAIEKGAVVKNCIIMQGSRIGKNAHIEQTIIDKDVTVAPFRILVGVASAPVIINKGERV